MIFPNAFVSTTRAGTAIYTNRLVQFDDQLVTDKGQAPELQQWALSAGVPLLIKAVYDQPGSNYQRGDILTLNSGYGEATPPVSNPFYILRVQRPFDFLAATEVFVTRPDMLQTTVQWRQRLPRGVSSFSLSPTYDTIRDLPTTFADGTAGVGVTGVDAITGAPVSGYAAAQAVTVSVQEAATFTRLTERGEVTYEMPVLVFEPPLFLFKGDVIIIPDGRRGVVEDVIHRVEYFGVIIATMARLEIRQPDDAIYSI